MGGCKKAFPVHGYGLWWLQERWGWAALGIIPFPGLFPLPRPSTGDPTAKNPGVKRVRPMKRPAQAGSLLAAWRGHTMGLRCPDPHHNDSSTKRLG